MSLLSILVLGNAFSLLGVNSQTESMSNLSLSVVSMRDNGDSVRVSISGVYSETYQISSSQAQTLSIPTGSSVTLTAVGSKSDRLYEWLGDVNSTSNAVSFTIIGNVAEKGVFYPSIEIGGGCESTSPSFTTSLNAAFSVAGVSVTTQGNATLSGSLKLCAGVGSNNFFNITTTLSTSAYLNLSALSTSGGNQVLQLMPSIPLGIGSVAPVLIVNADASGSVNAIISQGSQLTLSVGWSGSNGWTFIHQLACTNGAKLSHLCFIAHSKIIANGGIRVAFGWAFLVGFNILGANFGVQFTPNFFLQANGGTIPATDGATCQGVAVGTQPGNWFDLCGGTSFKAEFDFLVPLVSSQFLVNSHFLKASVAIIPNKIALVKGTSTPLTAVIAGSVAIPASWSLGASCGTISPHRAVMTTYTAPNVVKNCKVKASTQGMLFTTSSNAVYTIIN